MELVAEEQAAYLPGRVVTWDAFSSASRREDRALRRNTRFVIRGRTSKDIRPYSEYPSEYEVLFMSGTRLRVVRPPKREGSITYIEVEEVDDAA